MVHLRIVVPGHSSDQAVALLKATHSAFNIIYLPGAAQKPEGDVILADVAREDASVVISDLRELEIDREGSIAIEEIDSQISLVAEEAERAAAGMPSDAVVWEEVEARTSEDTELSGSFLIFMVLSCLLAAVAIILDSPILLVGAMVVGPEFGPMAALCVALVQRRWGKVRRSLLPLVVGFPLAITAAYLFVLGVEAIGLPPDNFSASQHPNTQFISDPSGFSLIVAILAGAAGVLSLTTSKSGALVGVLISVTTIPAAANIAIAAAYTDGEEWVGAQLQLAMNLAAILLTGVVILFVQRKLYQRRRREHLHDDAREAAGLPVGRSRRDQVQDRPERTDAKA
jgi:uncharacterized hydrophobic protein (TIGR00271 family)